MKALRMLGLRTDDDWTVQWQSLGLPVVCDHVCVVLVPLLRHLLAQSVLQGATKSCFAGDLAVTLNYYSRGCRSRVCRFPLAVEMWSSILGWVVAGNGEAGRYPLVRCKPEMLRWGATLVDLRWALKVGIMYESNRSCYGSIYYVW